jgi:hypothetical protein
MLAYRKKVGEEFERLAAISERTPLFKKTERIYSDAFELERAFAKLPASVSK